MFSTPEPRPQPPNHQVQFYDTDEALFDRVAEFLSQGLKRKEPVVAIATAVHCQGFTRSLAQLGWDIAAACNSGRLTLLDADDTLAKFMVSGLPDRAKFEASVGAFIERTLASGPHARLRAYGEMVDVLWRAGNSGAALRLEDLWNELATQHDFDLLCGYTMASFYGAPAGLREVCERHVHVLPFVPAVGNGEQMRALSLEIARREQVEAELRQAIAALRVSEANERARARRSARLQEATARLAQAVSTSEVCDIVLETCASLLGAATSVLYLAGDDGRFRLAASRNAPGVAETWAELTSDTPLPLAHAMARGEGLWFESYDVLIAEFPQIATSAVPVASLQAGVALPLLHGKRVVGGIGLSFDTPREFASDDRDWLASFTSQCAVAAERARLYHAERRAIEELSETVRLNDLFAGILAHDLRNPLSAISAGAELLVARDPGAGPAHRILTSATRMARMIDQMLDFTRIRMGGGLPLDPRTCDLGPLLTHVVDELRAAHPGQTIRLAVEGTPTGSWDEDRLGQALSNLIGNAAQHGQPEAGVDVRVDTHDPQRLRIAIHNAGAISPELVPRLFEPMTGGQRRRDGSRGLGLGLFITHEIIRVHGGSLEVHSSEAEGTTFVMTLPRDAAAQPLAVPVTEPAAIAHARRSDRLRVLVESVRDYAIFMLDPTGHVVTWNKGAEIAKGYSASEIVGRSIEVFYTPEDRDRGHPRALLAQAVANGRVEDEGWRVRKDGTRFWADVVITALHDDSGELTGFAKVTRDLTERRMAEEQLRRSEERFRLMIEGIKDYSMIMLDSEGRVVTWNAGAERIHGYRSHEIIGEHISRFYPAEAAPDRTASELAAARRDGHVEDEGWRVRKDGTAFWSGVVLTAVRNPRGELAGFVKVTRDLTERKRLEQEMIRFAHAQEGIRLRDEFLSLVSHELKTPLTGLQLQLDSLQATAGERDPRIGDRLARVSATTTRLHELIEMLLDVSRIATGRFTLSLERFDLGAAVGEIVDSFQAAAARAGSLLVAQVQPIEGAWDRVRVQQVVTNLIANALKYAPGKPIEVRLSRDDGTAVLEVQDRGPGIPERDLERIFDRFERAVTTRHYGGLGLGLFVVREIAEAHGGSAVASNLAPGALFTVRLPVAS